MNIYHFCYLKKIIFLHQCRYQPRYSQENTNHPEGIGSSGNGGVGSQTGDSEVSRRLAQKEASIIPLDKERHQCSGLPRSWECLARARIMGGAFPVGSRATKSPRGGGGGGRSHRGEPPPTLPKMSQEAEKSRNTLASLFFLPSVLLHG